MKTVVNKLILISLLAGILISGCHNPPKNVPIAQSVILSADDLKTREKIEKITQALNQPVIANDYETQLKYFSEHALIMPPLGPVVQGKNKIKVGFTRNMEDQVVVHSFNATIEDFWVCGDRVYERGEWAMSQSTNKSKIPMAFYGSYFQIWRTQPDSSLLIDYNIFTLGFNPFEGNR